jgi:hypothetical protein
MDVIWVAGPATHVGVRVETEAPRRVVTIHGRNVSDLEVGLDHIGAEVEDLSLVAVRNVRPDALGFANVDIPSTTYCPCGPRDWCGHYEPVDTGERD